MEERLELKQGTRVYFDKPVQPLPEAVRHDIAALVRTVDEIREAHLVLWYVHDRPDPAHHVLVIVVESSERGAVFDRLGDRLADVLPKDFILDVFPASEQDGILDYIRGCRCEIYRASDWKTPGSQFVH